MPRRPQTGHTCMIPGCLKEGRNRIGLRARLVHAANPPVPKKGRTSALWSTETEGYICDGHALGGAHFTILLEPNKSKSVTTKVIASATTEERTTDIKQ